MTVSNVILEASRGRLVADTLAYIGKEPALLHRKIRVAPRAGLAFIVRGRVILADHLEARSGDWRDFEAAAADIEAVLVAQEEDWLSHGLAEVTLVGWHQGRAVAARITGKGSADDVRVTRADLSEGVYLAPALGSHAIPPGLSDDQIFKISLLQQGIAVKHGLNMCVGGDIEVAEVTAAGVVVRSLGEYPDKALAAARIAKVGEATARLEAAA